MSITTNKYGWDRGKLAAGGEPSTYHQLIADVSIGVGSDTFLTVERSSEIGAQQREQKEGPHVLHGHRDIGMVLQNREGPGAQIPEVFRRSFNSG